MSYVNDGNHLQGWHAIDVGAGDLCGMAYHGVVAARRKSETKVARLSADSAVNIRMR